MMIGIGSSVKAWAGGAVLKRTDVLRGTLGLTGAGYRIGRLGGGCAKRCTTYAAPLFVMTPNDSQ